jgi:hypothetical protein
MKCDKCGYDDNGTGDTAHVCGYNSIKLMDGEEVPQFATAAQPMDEYEEDFDIVVSTLQKQIDKFEQMNKESHQLAMNMGWGCIGIMDEIRYEQIWQMKKAIKIWNLLKDELA